jgi:hypothetical protein
MHEKLNIMKAEMEKAAKAIETYKNEIKVQKQKSKNMSEIAKQQEANIMMRQE